jgi:hypothetical protein
MVPFQALPSKISQTSNPKSPKEGNLMAFVEEKTGYTKAAISDLQGAWIFLREKVVEEFGFKNSDKVLFHIDEAMSWETVRNLKLMEPLILVIENLVRQSDCSDELLDTAKNVRSLYNDTLAAIKEGRAD